MFMLLTLFGHVYVCTSHEEAEEISRVLLISMDGFRWDYLDMANNQGRATPNFQMLIDNGVVVRSPGVRNVFVTKTFPNHYSLVTGLYEESHGVVENQFYDPVYNETFDIPKSDNIKWWNGTGSPKVQPLWVTNDNVGDEHHVSGSFLWPGSGVDGMRPTYYVAPYNESIPFDVRASTVAGWFTQEKRPINFGLMYYHEPDVTGHAHGPNSAEMVDMIVTLDRYVGDMIKLLKDKQIFDELNIVLTSDHGMAEITDRVYLDDYVNSSLYRWFGGSPVANILPKEGMLQHVCCIYNCSDLKKIVDLFVINKFVGW